MNQEILRQMKDIHLPEDPSWWPLAPGWWWLLGMVIMLSCVGLVLRYRYRQRSQTVSSGRDSCSQWVQQQKQALQILETWDQILSRQPERSREILGQLSRLMKRLALDHPCAQYDVAGLTGRAWLQWLDRHHDKKGVFASALGDYWICSCLTEHNPPQHDQDMALIHACRDWIQKQAVQEGS